MKLANTTFFYRISLQTHFYYQFAINWSILRRKKYEFSKRFWKITHGIFHHRLLFQCRLLLEFRKFSTVDYYSMATIIWDKLIEYIANRI